MISRCWAALFPRANFLDVLDGNPDLYGPFWIATTVIFILFLGGTISQYLASERGGTFVYDFKLLSGTSCEEVLHIITAPGANSLVIQVPRASYMDIRSSFPSRSSSH